VEELLSFHIRRAHLLTDGIAVTRHAARGRERIGALAVRFERGVRQKRWRRRAIHVWLFLEISSWLRGRRRTCRIFLPSTPEIARPLRAQQHIVLPGCVAENVLELLIHPLCFICQCDNARDLAPKPAVVEFKAVLICWLPGGRRRLVHRTLRRI